MKVDTKKIEYEPLSKDTLPACVAIAQHAPDPWDETAFQNLLKDKNRWSFLALQEGQVLGFVCYLALAGSADLEMLVVAPEARRQGVARRLLMHSLPILRGHGITAVLLEARVSNKAAISLYTDVGFKHISLRRAMYGHPVEDGVLMALSMRPLK